jgi:uncharacterized protein
MKALPLIDSPVLWAALLAWFLAQTLKIPIEYFRSRKWEWVLWLRAGGMPSSHSAFVSSTSHAVGLFHGFETPLFAVSVVLAVIVIYDATGIRRQAGMHAELINAIIKDLREGHPLRQETQEQLREVLGHTPFEAVMGTILGIVIAQLLWFWVA